MRQNYPCSKRCNEFIKTLVFSLLAISSLTLKAQTPTSFTGKWEFDKTNSDKDNTGDASVKGTIILEIIQTSDTITFSSTIFLPGRDGFRMRPDKFPANGDVIQDNSGSDPAKKFVKWSADKKTLTTNYIMTATIDGAKQDFITTNTYNLNDDGKTLVVVEFNKSLLNGEKTVKKIYRKK